MVLERNLTPITKLVIGVFALLVAMQFGLSYGTGTQTTYLIGGLAKIHSDWFLVDWFARSTIHYHDSFSAFLQFIDKVGLPLAETTIVIELLIRLTGIAALFWICFKLANKQAAVAFFAIAMLGGTLASGQSLSMAFSFIFYNVLQPSSFSSGLYLVGIALLVGRYYGLSGIAFGLAGYMHSNFLLAALMVLPLTHLLLGRQGLVSRSVVNLTPLLIVFAIKLPLILSIAVANPELQAAASEIFFKIRAPHHYYTPSFLYDYWPFLGWVVAGLSAYFLTRTPNYAQRTLFAWVLSILLLVTIATLLTTVVFIPVVAKLFVFRLAPFAVVCAQILFFVACASAPENHHSLTSRRGLLACTGMIGGAVFAVALYKSDSLRQLASFSWCFLLPLLVFSVRNYAKGLGRLGLSPAVFRPIVVGAYLLCFSAIFYAVYPGFVARSTVLGEFPPKPDAELFEWAAGTPVDTLFAVPPGLDEFRLHSHRSIVIDFKSTPLDAPGMLEWYRRVEDVSGIPGVRSRGSAEAGYQNITPSGMLALRDKYNVDYVVVELELDSPSGSPFSDWPVVFKNSRYIAYSMQP